MQRNLDGSASCRRTIISVPHPSYYIACTHIRKKSQVTKADASKTSDPSKSMLRNEIILHYQSTTTRSPSPLSANGNNMTQLLSIPLIRQRDIKQELGRHNKVSRVSLNTILITLKSPAINPQLSQLSIRKGDLVQPADQWQWTAGTSPSKQLLHDVVLQLGHDQTVGEDPDEAETGGEKLGIVGAVEFLGVHPVLNVAEDLWPLEVVDGHVSALAFTIRAVETSCQHWGVVRREFLEQGVGSHVRALAYGERNGGEMVTAARLVVIFAIERVNGRDRSREHLRETRRRMLSNGYRRSWSIEDERI